MPSSSSVEPQVKYRSIRDLSVNPQNARTHSNRMLKNYSPNQRETDKKKACVEMTNSNWECSAT
jgi:hypothetical protein